MDDKKQETRNRLLAAAEKLYAEKGFASVSLRDITNEAGANVAAVNYYFGSKEALADAVIAHHVGPVNDERLKLLKVLEKDYKGAPIPLRKLMDAFMRPMIRHVQRDGVREQLFSKIMGRCMSDKAQALPEEVAPLIKKVLGAYVKAFQASLPEMSAELVLWRLHFSFGVIAHTLTYSDRLQELSGRDVPTPDLETTLTRVVDYCCGGFLHGQEQDEDKPGDGKPDGFLF